MVAAWRRHREEAGGRGGFARLRGVREGWGEGSRWGSPSGGRSHCESCARGETLPGAGPGGAAAAAAAAAAEGGGEREEDTPLPGTAPPLRPAGQWGAGGGGAGAGPALLCNSLKSPESGRGESGCARRAGRRGGALKGAAHRNLDAPLTLLPPALTGGGAPTPPTSPLPSSLPLHSQADLPRWRTGALT